MPNWSRDDLTRAQRRNPNLVPAGQVQDSKPLKRPKELVRRGEGEAQSSGRVALRFTLRRVRLLDVCAKHQSCKALIDGLRYAALIRDDREEDITLQVDQEKVAHYEEEETLIWITYPTSSDQT